MKTIIILLAILFTASCAYADFGFEFNFSENFSDNLLLDSSSMGDSYSRSAAKFNYYPISQVQVSFNSEYNYYHEIVGLGNVVAGGSITAIPTPDDFPLALYLNLNYQNRSYRESFSVYNTNDFDVLASLGFNLAGTAQMRFGTKYSNSRYTNSDEADKETVEVFAGSNVTLFGSNSFDLEVGYSFANYSYIDTSTIYTFPQELGFLEGDLKMFYISPRYSRQLGNRIGMTLTFYYSEFKDYKGEYVLSYATGFLSPWASVWDGRSVTLNFKAYIIPRVILNCGMGYWDKRFLTSLEPLDWIRYRDDDQRRIYIDAAWPMPMSSGMHLEPSLRIDYQNNNSTYKLYEYDSFSATLSLLIRF